MRAFSFEKKSCHNIDKQCKIIFNLQCNDCLSSFQSIVSIFIPTVMSIEKRRFIRFSLDIPVTRFAENGRPFPTYIRQVSVGGCMTDWEDDVYAGDEFRIEMQLPNKNKLPIMCKAIYRFAGKGLGVKFHDISQFEQELIAQIISENLLFIEKKVKLSYFKTDQLYLIVD